MKLYPNIETNRDHRIHLASVMAAGKVKFQGGDLLAQDHAGIYAAMVVRSGKSAATAIDEGYKAGMRIFNNAMLRQQAI